MKFFKNSKNWRLELSDIGFAAFTVMFAASFLVLGNNGIWVAAGAVPLFLPLGFGNRSRRIISIILIMLSIGGAYLSIQRQREWSRRRQRQQQQLDMKNRQQP